MQNKYEDFTDLITTSYQAIQKIKTAGTKDLDLKAADVNCIYYLSKHKEGLSNAGLADLTGVDKAAISRTSSRLIKNGYVAFSPEDEDKKYGRRYVLTEKGNAAAEAINQKVGFVVEEAGKNVSMEERDVFYKTFHSISEQLVKLSEAY